MTTVLITKVTTQFIVDIHVFGSMQKKNLAALAQRK